MEASERARLHLIEEIEADLKAALIRQGLSETEVQIALNQILDDNNKAQIMKFTSQLEARPGKGALGYTYFTVARIPRPIVGEIIGQSIMKSDTLQSFENVSRKALLMSISKENNR